MSVLPLVFASLMTGVDSIVFSLVKQASLKALSPWFVPLGMALYALQPFILWNALTYESLTVMNVLWNLMSSLTIGMIGMCFFQEKVGPRKVVAVVFALMAVYLFTFEDGYSEVETYLRRLFT